MKFPYITLLLIILIGACTKSNSDTLNDGTLTTNLQRSASGEIPKSDGDFNIDKGVLNENTWTFTISHSGGCDPGYHFLFLHKPKITADCVSDTIHVVLKTNNNCKRLDYTTVNVNLGNYNICSKKLFFLGGTKVLEISR